jgi:alpha-tubulin suppressor-like RCC1 family protein
MKNAIVSILVCLLFSFVTSSAQADSIIRGGEWGDAAPAVAYNTTDHEYLVVWNEFMTIWPFFGPVMGRRLGVNGEKLGPPFKIFDSGVKPAVAYDANNNRYCVVCESNYQTHLCFLDARGKKTGTPLPYADSTFPEIYYNSLDNSFLLLSIHIQENQAGSGNCDRMLTAMSIDGNGVSGTRYTVSPLSNDSCTAGEYFAAAFAPIDSALTPQGRYLVGIGSVKSPLYMLNRNGERVLVKPGAGGTGYEIAFQSEAEIPENLDIAFGYRNGNGGDPVFLVIWGERGNKYFDGEPWTGIYGGVVDADQDDYSGEVNNYTFPISLQWSHLAQRVYAETWNPQAGYNPATGRFVVIWRETPGPSPDPRDLAENNHIRAETLKTLERSWPDGNFLISKDIAAADPGLPALSAAGPSPLAVWQDNRNAAVAMSDIYGALINVGNKTTKNMGGNGRGWIKISAGARYSLGIRNNNTLWAWGYNSNGQLGTGDTISTNTPTQVGTWDDWVFVSAGFSHSLGIRSNGSLWAWGRNLYGELGTGGTTYTHTPTRVGTWSDWIAVDAGTDHSLGIRSDGSLWSWGSNLHGELGLGNNTATNTPTRVGAWNWVQITAGLSNSLGIRADGFLYAWGFNNDGQLGLGDTADRNIPTRIGTWNNWVKATTKHFHSLGIRADGSLYAWGLNSVGQLGLGNMSDTDMPAKVGVWADWFDISAGSYFTLGLRAGGSLYGWGYNTCGNLGTGNTTSRESPTRAGTFSDWIVVSAGEYHSLGIRADGSLWSWGLNDGGQLGLGDNRERHVPTLVGRKFPWPMFLPALLGHGRLLNVPGPYMSRRIEK